MYGSSCKLPTNADLRRFGGWRKGNAENTPRFSQFVTLGDELVCFLDDKGKGVLIIRAP